MFRNLTPVVRALLYLNLIVYLLEWLTGDRLLESFALWPLDTGGQFGAWPFEPWQLVTYAFLHDTRNVVHLLGNMLALYMFGPDAERTLGARRFCVYYFACVVGAGLTQLWVLHQFMPGQVEATIGASGGIFGLLLFYGMVFPQRKLMLLFPPLPWPIPAWLFVTLYAVFELTMGVSGRMQGVAHFAHLGGAATGLLLILFWRASGSRGAS
jgi:rhomboid family protein